MQPFTAGIRRKKRFYAQPLLNFLSFKAIMRKGKSSFLNVLRKIPRLITSRMM